ncbi:MAG: MaoC family dehydratase [Candidatus Lokiarchaeota archaeon]|nr:MaoC family dehydratase [Candidatus Lokiarchaeota archaeon]
MIRLRLKPSDWNDYIGKELGTSDWYEVTQEEISEYGRIVGDVQWIHTDPERAKKESPYGVTVAHGNWVLSIVHPKLLTQLYTPIETKMIVNYGWDKIRFPSPTPVGKRIRLIAKVADVKEASVGVYNVKMDYKVYVEDETKPCMAAIKVTRYYSF